MRINELSEEQYLSDVNIEGNYNEQGLLKDCNTYFLFKENHRRKLFEYYEKFNILMFSSLRCFKTPLISSLLGLSKNIRSMFAIILIHCMFKLISLREEKENRFVCHARDFGTFSARHCFGH